MSLLPAEDLIFIDFEASGLGPQSWPIEIGLAWIEDGEVKSWSSLIRPAPNWSMDAWCPASERVHGISRAELDAAPQVHVVAAEAARLMAGRSICSDAPEFEERWAARLFCEQPGSGSVRVAYVYSAFALLCNEAQLDRLHEKLARLPAPHRAGPDAERHAKALLHALTPRPCNPTETRTPSL